MTKQDFLEKLQFALSGRLNASAVAEHVRYYEDYINTEIRKGKTAEEVLGALGDPRLIARTIAETNASQSAGRRSAYEEEAQGHSGYKPQGGRHKISLSGIPAWVWLILVLLVAALVIGAVFSVLSMVLPVLLPILAVLFLVKLFRDWMQ